MDDFVGPPQPKPPIVHHLERVAKLNAPLHPALTYGPLAANFYDAVATQYALGRGAQEANPILAPFADEPALLIGSKLAAGALTGAAANKLARSGHRNWAKALALFGIGVPLSAGTHNLIRASQHD